MKMKRASGPAVEPLGAMALRVLVTGSTGYASRHIQSNPSHTRT